MTENNPVATATVTLTMPNPEGGEPFSFSIELTNVKVNQTRPLARRWTKKGDERCFFVSLGPGQLTLTGSVGQMLTGREDDPFEDEEVVDLDAIRARHEAAMAEEAIATQEGA